MSTLIPRPIDAGTDLEDERTQVIEPAAPRSAVEQTYRLPSVDLLPPEVLAGRRFRRTQQRTGVALAAVLAGLVGGYVLVLQDASEASAEYRAEQARTTELQAQQAQYARAPQVYAEVEAAQGALREAMADDVRWYTYLADLAVTAPDGVWITDVTASVDSSASATATASGPAPLAATDAPPAVGTISVNGTVREEPQVADWLEVLDATPGLTGATTTSITRSAVGDQAVFPFVSTATITTDALSRRFEQETD